VPDFSVLAAADHLEQDAERSGIGNLERIEIADRRKLAVAADREPVIEHARVLAPFGGGNGAQRTEQCLGRCVFDRIHFRNRRAHPQASPRIETTTFGAVFLEKVKGAPRRQALVSNRDERAVHLRLC